MKIIDPGHLYSLDWLDLDVESPPGPRAHLQFVKRMGERYPGNDSAYPGTTVQEVLRVLIDRIRHVNMQRPHCSNANVILSLREAIWHLESRAKDIRGEKLPPWEGFYLMGTGKPCVRIDIENEPTCVTCGHIRCEEHPCQ